MMPIGCNADVQLGGKHSDRMSLQFTILVCDAQLLAKRIIIVFFSCNSVS